MLHIPAKARGVGICFSWKQPPTVPKAHSESVSLSTTPSVYGYPDRGDIVPKYTESSSNTTAMPPFFDKHAESITTDENINIAPVHVNDHPSEEYPAETAYRSGSKIHQKIRAKGKSKKPVYKVGGKTFGRARSLDEGTGTYQGCWALDHVIIVSTAHLPENMQDKFDPVDPGNWLMFPGAHFKVSKTC